MDTLGIVKVLFGSAAAIFGVASCVLWFASTRAEVLFSDAPSGNTALTYHVDGREIELVSSMMKQSRISAWAASCAAIAALMQVFLTLIQISEL